jgi:hypothetical protein
MMYVTKHAMLEYLATKEESLRNIQRCLCNVYGCSALNRSTSGCWTKKVTASGTGKEELPKFPHSVRPVTAVSPEILQECDAIICEDQCIKTQQLALKSFNLQGKC